MVDGDLDRARRLLVGERGKRVPPLLESECVCEHAGEIDPPGRDQFEVMVDAVFADAVDRLSRGYERAFLEQVGPIALSAAGAPVAPAPEPARAEVMVQVRDRRSFVERMRDWFRRAA